MKEGRGWVAVVLLCSSACALSPEVRIADELGPDPTAVPEAGSRPGWGGLRVHCDSQLASPDRGPDHPNGQYVVVDRSGHRVATVRDNSSARAPQEPRDLPLPAGSYRVDAPGLGGHLVEASIRVVTGRTTEVHLEKLPPWTPTEASGAELVRGPDGEVIGWRASGL